MDPQQIRQAREEVARLTQELREMNREWLRTNDAEKQKSLRSIIRGKQADLSEAREKQQGLEAQAMGGSGGGFGQLISSVAGKIGGLTGQALSSIGRVAQGVQQASGGVAAVGQAGQAAAMTAGGTGAAGGAATAAAGGASAALGPVALIGMAAMDLAKTFKDAGQMILATSSSYAQYASPGVVERMNMAFENLYAAVGVMLLPVVDATSRVVNQFNAIITASQGRIGPIIQTLANGAEALFKYFTSLVSELMQTPIVGFVVSIISGLANSFATLANAVLTVAATFNEVRERLLAGRFRDAFNWADVSRAVEQRRNAGPGNMTFAARQPEFVGLEEVGRRAQLAALGSQSIQEQQLEAQQEANRHLERIAAQGEQQRPARGGVRDWAGLAAFAGGGHAGVAALDFFWR